MRCGARCVRVGVRVEGEEIGTVRRSRTKKEDLHWEVRKYKMLLQTKAKHTRPKSFLSAATPPKYRKHA